MLYQSIVTVLIISLRVVSSIKKTSHQYIDELYPSRVPFERVRKDVYTSHPVTRGRIQILAETKGTLNMREAPNSYDGSNRVTLEEFQKSMQCAPYQPNLHNKLSSFITSFSTEYVQIVAAHMESNCEPWSKCRTIAKKYLNGTYPAHLSEMFGGFRAARLFRVIKGELYIDWPWGLERFTQVHRGNASAIITGHDITYNPEYLHPILYSLSLISDLPNSLFMVGGEQSIIPYRVPFPVFSFSPAFNSGDMPYPWPSTFIAELDLYRRYLDHHMKSIGMNDRVYHQMATRQVNWSERIPKAVFYGHIGEVRQTLYDIAVAHPELIVAKFTCSSCKIAPLNPLSEEIDFDIAAAANLQNWANKTSNEPGYIEDIKSLYIPQGEDSRVGNHKYVVVLLGLNTGSASADRLASLLAHSGSVILLQECPFSYHFSAFLKPWVHYVPISYSLVDIVPKIEWLQRNDHLARIIAANARNFGASYLRLEDYLCYAASALEVAGELTKNVAAEGFSPVKLPFRIV